MERVVGRKEGNKFGEVGGGAKRGRGKESMMAPKKHESFFFNFQPAEARFLQTPVSICSSVSQSISLSASLSISQLSCELVSKSVSLSIFIPINLSISLSLSVTKIRFVNKSVNQSVCLSLFVCQCVF